jgi:outer membrane protein assembly factor BamB
MRRALVVIGLALLLAACTSGKSNVEPPAPLVKFTPTAKVKKIWSTDIGKGEKKKIITLAPALDGNVLYTTDPAGRVSALATDAGRNKWRVKTEEPAGAIGFGEGLVLLGTKKGEVIALDRENGGVRWRATLSSEVLAAPSASNGVVVAQTIDGRVFALSAQDGKQLWSQQRAVPALSLHGTSTPVIYRGLVFAGFASGKISAVELKTGRLVWERAVAYPRGRSDIERLIDVDAPPLLAGDSLFAASYQGRLVAINIANGRVRWSRELSTYSGMAADDRNVYVTNAAGDVLALDQGSGAALWKQDKLRARVLNSPAVTGEYVVVGDIQGYVHWLLKENGRFAVRARLRGGPIRGRMISAGNTLFVQGQGGVVAALRVEPRPASN